jgi:hypothetical protein
MVFMQYGGLLSVRNRRVSILQSNPFWGPRRNLAVPMGMIGTALIGVTNLYGPGLQKVFSTTPIPGMFWGLPFTFALGILCMDEMRKLIVRTYPNVSRFEHAFLSNMLNEITNSQSLQKWHGNICGRSLVMNCTMYDTYYASLYAMVVLTYLYGHLVGLRSSN